MSIIGLLEEQESPLDFVALEEQNSSPDPALEKSEPSSSASDQSLEGSEAVDDFSGIPEEAAPRVSEHWLYHDPVDEAIDTLRRLGHAAEAEIIEAVLSKSGGPTDDDLLMRAYVSGRWAEEWDSEEYSIYDES